MLNLPVGSNPFLFGYINLTDQKVTDRMNTKKKCGPAITGEECIVAAYGTIVTHPKKAGGC
jgi:hypothetical protein